jgi:hypothetical protein
MRPCLVTIIETDVQWSSLDQLNPSLSDIKGLQSSESSSNAVHKRRQKSYGHDSPEVVTAGQSHICYLDPSSELFFKIIYDLTGKQNWQLFGQRSLDAQIVG